MIAAIARCVEKHGLAASTQEVMATESGFSRSHIRHYLGNRDDVIDAVWDYVVTPYQERIRAAATQRPPQRALDALLDYLFGPEMEAQPEDRVIVAVIQEAARHPRLRDKVRATYVDIIRVIARVLRAIRPSLRRQQAQDVAFSIVSLAIAGTFFSAMSFSKSRRQAARRTARALVDSL
jgi:AcrR family transcriptional regulator